MAQNKLALACTVLLASATLSACAGTAGTAGGSGGGGAAESNRTVAFAQRNFESDWWAAQTDGVRAAVKKAGVDLLESDGRGDPVVQNSNVQNYITKGANAVILNPADPRGVTPSVNALEKAGIPLIAVNSNLDPSLAAKTYCYVAEDQEATAAGVGKELASVAAKAGLQGPVKAVMVGGFPGEVVTDLRTKGFLKGYESSAEAPKLDMLPTVYGHWVADEALSALREVATGNPDLKLIFVASDSMLPAVQSALKSMGTWDTAIIGTYDGAMSTVKYMMDNPNGPIFADGANSPDKQGEVAVEMAIAAIEGKPQSETCPGGVKYITTPLYTPKNASEHFKDGRKF
jgi:ribose transport system substrate-binding protein